MKKKRKFYTVTIEGCAWRTGSREGGFPLFIENNIPGEVVRVKTMKVEKSYGYARAEEWLKWANRVGGERRPQVRVGTRHMTCMSQQRTSSNKWKMWWRKSQKLPEWCVQRLEWSALDYRNSPVRAVGDLLMTGFFKKNSWLNSMKASIFKTLELTLNGRSWYFKKVSVVAYDEANNGRRSIVQRMQASDGCFAVTRTKECCKRRRL